MDDSMNYSVADTLAYIHMKAARKGTKEAYQTAIDELHGVWLFVHHAFGHVPWASIAIMNLQQQLTQGLDSEEYRQAATEALNEAHRGFCGECENPVEFCHCMDEEDFG